MKRGVPHYRRLAALGVCLLGMTPASAANRSFLMGTTIMADFFQFKYESLGDKDMISIHVDDFIGIPWTQFEHGSPLPASWVSQVAAIRDGAAVSGKVIYLALGPLEGRKILAKRVDDSGALVSNWAPVDSSGCYPFATDSNATAYKSAYLNYVKYMVDQFHPTYLSIVIEMNIEFAACPAQKEAFKQWYTDLYHSVKEAYPSLVVFPTFQAEYMYGISDPSLWCGGVKTDTSWGDCFQERLDEAAALPSDRMAYSTYPLAWINPPTAPDHYTPEAPLDDMFARTRRTTSRKIWISETGWTGLQIWTSYEHTAPPSSCGYIAISTPTIAGEITMTSYMNLLLAQAKKHQLEAVVWWLNRDLLDHQVAVSCSCAGTNATCSNLELLYQIGGTALEIQYRFFGNMGLRYNDGTPRAAVHDVWMSYLNQPFTTNPSGGNASIDAVQIYPNPLRPSRGQTGMNFIQLPPGGRVRIYTLTGEKVKDLTVDAIGHATWDGTNSVGHPVASGVYMVFIQGAGDSKTISVAVER